MSLHGAACSMPRMLCAKLLGPNKAPSKSHDLCTLICKRIAGDAAGRAKRGREEQGTDGEGQGPESMDVEAPTDQQQQQAAAPEAGGQQAAKQAKQGQEAGAAAAKPAGAAAAAADAGSMPGDCLVYVSAWGRHKGMEAACGHVLKFSTLPCLCPTNTGL